MNILLVNPPFESPFIREGRCQSPQSMRKNSIPQMTLAYMAGVLERDGHDLRVYDCIAAAMNGTELIADLEESDFEPQIAFINTTTPTISADLAFTKSLKDRYPNLTTAVFGTHVTALHREVLQGNEHLDVVIRNEPEFAARELAFAKSSGKTAEPILGCTVRSGDTIEAFPDRPMSDNLDDLELPAWQYLPLDQYIHPVFNKPYLSVNTSRGCRHQCIFCVAPKYYGRVVRFRTPESIVREIRSNIDKFCVRHFWFYSDDYTSDPEYVKSLCRMIIEDELEITWWSNTRVDKSDEQMFTLMKRSGASMLSIGGESGSRELLRKMKKGIRPESIINQVKLLRKVGIDSVVYFLFGNPGETRDTIRETIDFAKKLNPDYAEFYPATPYPGTEFYEIAVREGHLHQSDWNDFQYSDTVIGSPDLSSAELRALIKRAYLEFYLRPSYIPVVLRKLARPRDFVRLMRFGFGYLKGIFRT